MKRSEMVMKLSVAITDCMSVTDNMIIAADCVLTKLEELGMCPPLVITNEIDPSNPFLDKAEFKWEPEEQDDYCGAV